MQLSSQFGRFARFLGAAATGGVLVLGSMPAPVPIDVVDDSRDVAVQPTPDRVVDRTEELLPTEPYSRALVPTPLPDGGEVPLPAGVELVPGEIVQVDYRDGVAVYYAMSAACTVTSTVGNPYRSGNTAYARHTHGLSSGCADSALIEAHLESHAAPWWHGRDWSSRRISPGFSTSWVTSRACANSNATSWRALNMFPVRYAAAQSPEVRLACNPG